MKEILFLFMLDYSGSMYQDFDQSVKYETVYKNVNAIASAGEQNSLSTLMIFGTETAKGCNDIRTLELSTAALPRQLRGMKPDKFGQTPLARTLRQGISYAIKNEVQNLITITDGADSCQEDPCQELAQSNQRLKSAGKKIKLLLIGYDVSKEKEKFQCFKNLQLSQIQIDYVSAANSFQLQQKLMEINKALQSQILNQNLKNSSEGLGDSGTQKPSRKNSAKDRTQKEKASPQPSVDSMLEILGAPVSTQFTAKTKDQTKKWLGGFATLLAVGEYTVSSDYPKSREISVVLGKGQRLVKNWADFFAQPKSEVKINSRILSYEWQPEAPTRVMHASLEPFITYGPLNSAQKLYRVPFGQWTLKVISPPWLKNLVPDKKINVEPETPQDLGELQKLPFVWKSSPDAAKAWVLEISYQGRTERHFIQSGVEAVPVLEEMQVKWLSGTE